MWEVPFGSVPLLVDSSYSWRLYWFLASMHAEASYDHLNGLEFNEMYIHTTAMGTFGIQWSHSWYVSERYAHELL